MEQTRRLYQLWSWLPAFRVVGETRHLPTASSELHVSASSLSRSIKQLEGALGGELFIRTPRGLELSDAGETLLEALREGMSAIDDGVRAVEAGDSGHQITIATSTPFARELVLPAVRSIRGHSLSPRIVSIAGTDVGSRLLARRVDLVVTSDPLSVPDLTIVPLLEMRQGVYCGPGHPLHGASMVTLDDLIPHPFVVRPTGVEDGWSSAQAREIGLVVSQSSLAVDACVDGDLLAVLPDLVAARAVHQGRLRRLPVELGVRTTVSAVHRSTGLHQAHQVLLRAMQARARSLAALAGARQDPPTDTVRLPKTPRES